MKLISMTDYCQEVSSEFMSPKKPFDKNYWFGKILNYSDFLKQPLALWMFVPCDEEGNTLEIIPFNEHKQGSNFEFKQHQDYEQAKERCLFDGFEYIISNNPDVYGLLLYGNDTIYPDNFNTIEDVAKYKPKLTLTAIKQIGL